MVARGGLLISRLADLNIAYTKGKVKWTDGSRTYFWDTRDFR